MNEGPPLILHGYWRSTASYRVRIALNLKGLTYRQITHDLRRGEQGNGAYLALNPQGLVPALETRETVLSQSGAIIEWLDERYPEPPLLPADPDGRAIVRSMAMIVGSDIHPLNNLRVLSRLRGPLGCDEAEVQDWMSHWMRTGFAALEELVSRHGGRFAYGDTPTLADCFIVPQIYAARRFNVAVEDCPLLVAATENAGVLEALALAHPDRQPDADA